MLTTLYAVVVPIMFGTGINIKMIEAMSFGIPVISTKCGIKGVNSNSKYHSANSMKELINDIVDLYNNQQDINQLTELSKSLFMEFYNKNAKTFDECFTKEFLCKKINNSKKYLNQNIVCEKPNKTNCSGCGVCAGVCPNNALKMELNSDGFYRPVRQKGCNNCGLCETVCAHIKTPKIKSILKNDDVFGRYLNVYSTYSKDTGIRYNASTAGFIRSFVAENIKRFDGVISLTKTDDPLLPEFKLLTCVDEFLKCMTKSIYFAKEGSEIVKLLKENKGKFIVIGLPCQIATLKNIDSKIRKRIFTIELFCGAVYSLNLMEKYFNLKNIKPDKIDFRDKEAGWHNISLSLSDNEILSNNNGAIAQRIIKTKANDDEFYFAQRNRFCTQEACLKCKYCYQGTADIQVGDFWGEKFKDDEKGVNIVLTRGYYADFLLKKCKNLSVKKCSIQDLHNSQPWFVEANKRIENWTKNIDQDNIDSLTNKLKLNRIMQDCVNKSVKISELRRVYEINKRKLAGILEKTNDSFVIVPSDCSSMQSFGDQAMNASLLSKIYEKYPNAEISYFSFFNSKDFVEFENDYGFKINILRPNENETRTLIERFREQTEKYQTVIVIGADILDGGCGVQQAVDYYKIILEALYAGKKVIITGMSFNNKNCSEVIEELINVSHAGAIINVRDDVSYSRLKQLGCKNLVQVSDMAFLFDETKYKTSEFANGLKEQLENYKKQGKKIIALHLTSTKEKVDEFIDKVIKSLGSYKDTLFVAYR